MSQVEIPDGWQQLHWKQQVALATQISEQEVTGAAQAKAIIGQERKRRLNADAPMRHEAPQSAPPEPVEGEKMIPLILLRDAWDASGNRVPANGKVSQWPLTAALRFLESGVAKRGDPIPGT